MSLSTPSTWMRLTDFNRGDNLGDDILTAPLGEVRYAFNNSASRLASRWRLLNSAYKYREICKAFRYRMAQC